MSTKADSIKGRAAQAVRLVPEEGKSVTAVARDIDSIGRTVVGHAGTWFVPKNLAHIDNLGPFQAPKTLETLKT